MFDLLTLDGRDLRGDSYDQRRACLVSVLAGGSAHIGVMPMTTNPAAALVWLVDQPRGIEGCVAKRRAQVHRPRVRAWRKVRARATSTAVIGGVIGSLERPQALILGVVTRKGRLRMVGRTRCLPKAARSELGKLLTPPCGHHPWPATLPASRFGQLPGGRISYTQVEPTLVVEFEHDLAFEHDRFRHATQLVQIRSELHPHDLPMAQ